MVSTEILVDGTVEEREVNDEEERLCLLGSRIYVDIFYALLDCRPNGQNKDIVEESIINLARFDAWVAIVLTSLKQEKSVVGIDRKCLQALSQVI